MGRPKPLLDFDGRLCLEVVLDACREGGVTEAIVVLGPGADPLRERIAARAGTLCVVNDRPERGQTSSVKIGLGAVAAGAAGFFILPADHPLIVGADLAILLDRFGARPAGGTILIPAHRGRRGHPVLMAAAHREAILALPDGVPLRDYIRARETEVEIVPAQGAGVVTGINTEDEYRAALAEFRRRRAAGGAPGEGAE